MSGTSHGEGITLDSDFMQSHNQRQLLDTLAERRERDYKDFDTDQSISQVPPQSNAG